jgi:formylmethanofuran dehydrogenase subunit D
MKYYDYDWDLEPNRILLDEELDIDKLGWKGGDMFKVINTDGRVQLVKVDPIEKFLKGYSNE